MKGFFKSFYKNNYFSSKTTSHSKRTKKHDADTDRKKSRKSSRSSSRTRYFFRANILFLIDLLHFKFWQVNRVSLQISCNCVFFDHFL